jgi:hypothetical protein
MLRRRFICFAFLPARFRIFRAAVGEKGRTVAVLSVSTFTVRPDGYEDFAFESLHASGAYKEEILRRSGDDTERSALFDVASSAPWPKPYTMRYLRNGFLDGWRGREGELAADTDTKRSLAEAIENSDLRVLPVTAGEAVDLIADLEPAADLVSSIARHAERILAVRAGAR